MPTVFRANLELIKNTSVTNSGRNTTTASGYRGHIIIEDEVTPLAMKFLEAMKFGKNDVIFETINKTSDYSKAKVGKNFLLKEGSKIIGTGTILERYE